eukprot:m.736407 g.736407  ORF g.736407 m.736407 type:complete len:580 (-) comp23095_c0_seq34:1526-3265(-)
MLLRRVWLVASKSPNFFLRVNHFAPGMTSVRNTVIFRGAQNSSSSCNSKHSRLLLSDRPNTTAAADSTRKTVATTAPPRHKLPLQICTIIDKFASPAANETESNGVDVGDEVVIHGWVQSLRKQKRVAFATLTDGSTAQPLQVVFTDPDHCSPALSVGASVNIRGTLQPAPVKKRSSDATSEQPKPVPELHVQSASACTIVGECVAEDEYVLAGKGHSLEYLREHLHMRCRTQTLSAMLRIRSALSQAMHQYFATEGFFEINTPILTTNDCEGGGDTFTVSADAYEQRKEMEQATDPRFFNATTHLTVSGQLHAEALAAALSRVYVLGPTFRAENSHSPRHLSEFYMLEAEASFADMDDAVTLSEQLLKKCMVHITETCEEDLKVIWDRERRVQKSEGKLAEDDLGSWVSSMDQPFAYITYDDAVQALQNSAASFRYPVTWGDDLKFEHEQWLAATYCKSPVFVVNYPLALKPFYMRENADGRTAAAFDLLVPGIGELVGGSAREDRHAVLLRKIEQHHVARGGGDDGTLAWYADLRKFGSVPHAGFGMGFERVVQYLTGLSNIRDAIPFPRHAGACRL